MDFEKFFGDLLSGEELKEMNVEDFRKYVNREKKLYIFKDYSNGEYYYLKLSDESYNLLNWLIDDIDLLDATLIPMDEIETHEF